MAVNGNQVVIEGFLDVKAPRGSNERNFIKAWRRMWVSASVIHPTGRGEPHLIFMLSKSSEEAPEKQIKTSRDGLRLFRCRSSSRVFSTWAVSAGGSLLLYLAAENEAQTQRWMQVIRDGLWPPIFSLQMIGNKYEVSLIDDEKTFAAGLLGAYGRLTCSTGTAMSLVHPHWGSVQLRWSLTDIRDIRLVRNAGNNSGVFNIVLKSSTDNENRNLQFYSYCLEDTLNWIYSLQIAKDIEREYLKRDLAKENEWILSSKKASNNASRINAQYRAVKKNFKFKRQESIDLEQSIESKSEDPIYGKVNKVNWSLKDISGDFLDASISSVRAVRTSTGESSSSNEEEIWTTSPWIAESSEDPNHDITDEHVYEDIENNFGKRTQSIGGQTLYEELDFSDDEYIPPTPPEVPKRSLTFNKEKQSNERLQMLSESVITALKQAEHTTPSSPRPRRKNIVKNVVKKCRSLHVSPTRTTENRTQPLEVMNRKPSIERRCSESDMIGEIYQNVLPLIPFKTQEQIEKSEASPSNKENREKFSCRCSFGEIFEELNTNPAESLLNITNGPESYSVKNIKSSNTKLLKTDEKVSNVTSQRNSLWPGSRDEDYVNMR